MSLEGNATAKTLRGKINSLDVLVIDAYGVAVRNGFKGTEAEWLASLKGEKGDKGDAFFVSRIAYIDLPAAEWQGNASPYSQVVDNGDFTANSQVDLTPSAEQLAIFHNKDIEFVTENEDGVVTVYCIGQKPVADYTIQATITEVMLNG